MSAKTVKCQSATRKLRLRVIRPGRRGSLEQRQAFEHIFFEKNIVGLDEKYNIGNAASKGRTYISIKESVAKDNPDLDRHTVQIAASNVVRLCSEVQVEDIVVCPSRLTKRCRIGVARSGYLFSPRSGFPHYRKINRIGWLDEGSLTTEANRKLGATRLFFECKRYADELLEHIETLLTQSEGQSKK